MLIIDGDCRLIDSHAHSLSNLLVLISLRLSLEGRASMEEASASSSSSVETTDEASAPSVRDKRSGGGGERDKAQLLYVLHENEGEKRTQRGGGELVDAPSVGFRSGNPKIEVTYGVIHLYHLRSQTAGRAGSGPGGGSVKGEHTSVSADAPLPAAARLFQPALPASSAGTPRAASARRDPLPRSRGLVLLALRIPHVVSMNDLLDKTKAFHDHVTTIRVVKRSNKTTSTAADSGEAKAAQKRTQHSDGDDEKDDDDGHDSEDKKACDIVDDVGVDDEDDNSYMVLITFRSQKWADDFFLAFNNMPFNSLEPELWRLLFVRDIEEKGSRTTVTSDGGVAVTGRVRDPTSPQDANGGDNDNDDDDGNDDADNNNDNGDGDGKLLPVELPTCPVCLELLDSDISGIVTTVCNHRFHTACLSRWNQNKCPVCKFYATTGTNPVRNARPTCAQCDCDDNIWICLICGYVGCGRYKHRHAIDHYHETQHNYSLDIDTGRIWDYKGDNWVHRIMSSKTEGMKIIELPIPSSSIEGGKEQTSRRGRRRRLNGQDTGKNGKDEQKGDADVGDGDDVDEDDRISDADSDTNGGVAPWQAVKGKQTIELGRLAAARAATSLRTRRNSNMLSQFEFDDDDGHIDTLANTKLEVFAFEYEHLLAAQLESQRLFYEEQLRQEQEAHVTQRSEMTLEHEDLERQREKLADENESLRLSLKESKENLKALEKKLSVALTARKEAETLRLLNDSLIANQKELKEQHERAQRERAEEARQVAAARLITAGMISALRLQDRHASNHSVSSVTSCPRH